MRAMTASTLALVTAASIAAGLPAGAQSGCGASYTVAPGDTLARIAARCDTSVGALVRANDQIRDPSLIRVGWRLKIPGARADRDGFAEDRPTDRSRVSTGGTYRVEPGDTLFSIAQAAGISLAALMDANRGIDPYALAIGQALNLPGFGQPPADNPADSLRVSLEGHVSRGVECPILTTPDGDVYSLSGEMTFTPGEYVEVTGETMDASTCMQGTPLRVTALKEVQPPQDGREEEKTVRYEGRVASGAECPVLKTPDGDVYALVSDNVEFTPGEYVEVDGRLAEFSTCMQGEGTLDVSEIREIAPSERERNRDRAEGPKLDLGYTPDRFSK